MAPDSEQTPRVPWLPVNEGEQKAVPATPAIPEPLTPTKPTVPAWIQREKSAESVEPEATTPPAVIPAEELLPSPGDTTGDDAEAEATTAPMPRLWSSDPVQLLGESAVASAALSASGAPTPLGGVPTVPAENAVTPPSFGSEAPLFTPKFAEPEPAPDPAANTAAGPSNFEKADALAAGINAHEQAELVSKGADLDGGVAYAPVTFGEAGAGPTRRAAAVAAGAGAGTAMATANSSDEWATEPAEEAPPSGPKKRRWWLWILLALLVVAGVAVAVALLNRPEPTVVPGVVITEPPPGPTITPVAAPTATAFQSAMPSTVGLYSLVDSAVLDPADIALTAGRVAEGVDLTYSSGDGTMMVRALQYYNEDDAKTMFTTFAGDGATTQPVEAGGATVGDSAVITAPSPGMVWRNGTSVLIVTGPALQLADFYAQFGL